jgi:hypothetical protein
MGVEPGLVALRAKQGWEGRGRWQFCRLGKGFTRQKKVKKEGELGKGPCDKGPAAEGKTQNSWAAGAAWGSKNCRQHSTGPGHQQDKMSDILLPIQLQ